MLCRITVRDLGRLKARLQDNMETEGKQVLFIRLCGACVTGIQALGVPRLSHNI